MSNDIKVGDLVMVAYEGIPCPNDCQKATNTLGRIFRVSKIGVSSLSCNGCWVHKGSDVVAYTGEGDGELYRLPRLKRIPPLDELEGVKDTQHLPETVK